MSLIAVITAVSMGGCKDLLTTPPIPDGTQSPSTYLSKTGGLALTNAATELFRDVTTKFILDAGLLTDELSLADLGSSSEIDSRNLPERPPGSGRVLGDLYLYLHQLRGQTRIARGVLAEYAPDLSPAIRGQLYAYEGYAELWLADLYCSGVPLSTLDYKADYTHRPSSTTQQVYEHAIVLFDSALALAADSANVQTLVTVGKGRALLALGRYEEAAAAVGVVSVDAAYAIRVLLGTTTLYPRSVFVERGGSVSDNEGENGLFFRTSGDPRTRSDTVALLRSTNDFRRVYFPWKYAAKDSTEITIASGVEAALIVAEAALKRGQPDVWLSVLNTLRTNGTYSRIDTAASGEIDTLWNAGSGRVAGLRPLHDPVDVNKRIDLMFAERAAWLFVSGHRQGDLRRLVREYGRSQATVYPTGLYLVTGTQIIRYRSDVNIPIPTSEWNNPYYRGCLSRDA